MRWLPWSDARVRGAASVAALCATLLGTATVQALRDPPIPQTPPLQLSGAVVAEPSRTTAPFDRLAALAPFSPNRAMPMLQPSAIDDNVSAPLTCLGMIAGSDQASAICRLAGGTPRILHAGDTLGGWRLTQVAPGRAVFIDAASRRRELRLSPSGH